MPNIPTIRFKTAIRILIFFCTSGISLSATAQYVFHSDAFVGSLGDTGIVSINLSAPWKASFSGDIPPQKIWNGPFRFQSSKNQKEPQWQNRNYIEIGNYSNGLASGEWTYTEQITNLQIQNLTASGLNYRINTRLISQKGTWKNGIRNGNWTYQLIENPVDNKIVKETLTYRFENGWLNGPIAYKNEDSSITIIGQIKEGLMVGDWQFLGSDGTLEHRIYEKGILISLDTKSEGDTQTWIFPLSSKCLDALKSREKTGDLTHYPMSLTFSDGYPQNSKWIQIQKNKGHFLSEIHKKIGLYLPKWQAEIGLAFGTNRCIYPLLAEEETKLAQWLELREKWQNITAKLQDTLLIIEEFPREKKFKEKLQIWIEIQNENWENTQTWQDIMESGRLVYYNRSGEVFNYAKALLKEDILHYSKGFESIKYPNNQNKLIAFLVENTQARIDTAAVFMDSLISIQKQYELSKFILQLSAQIRRLHDSLWAKCQRDTTRFGPFFALLQDLPNLYLNAPFDLAFQEFINETDIQQEQILGNRLLESLEGLDQLCTESKKLFYLWSSIDTFYTEYRVDAFTFERLKIRNKKRLFELFNTYVAQEIKVISQKNIQERLSGVRELKRLFQAFFYFRDRQTNGLERRLLKTKTHEERRRIWESV